MLPLSPSGGRPLPVPEGGGLHDGVQSSSGTEQVGRSSRNTTLTVLHFIFFFQPLSLVVLQSRRHGLVLRLHLGRHHPGVSHMYPYAARFVKGKRKVEDEGRPSPWFMIC